MIANPANQVSVLTVGEAGPGRIITFPLSEMGETQNVREWWRCEYCGRVNQSDRLACIGCGGPKVASLPGGMLLLQGISAAQWESVARDSRERLYFGDRIWR